MNWDDPEARLALVDAVGPQEYNRLFAEHIKATTVAHVNGYGIRPVGSRFGLLFSVDGASVAFRTQTEAEAHAATLPIRGTA